MSDGCRVSGRVLSSLLTVKVLRMTRLYLRFRYLAGLEDEREPAYAHYFFYKEVAIQIIATLQCTYYCLVNIFECFFSLNRNIRSTLISPQEPA